MLFSVSLATALKLRYFWPACCTPKGLQPKPRSAASQTQQPPAWYANQRPHQRAASPWRQTHYSCFAPASTHSTAVLSVKPSAISARFVAFGSRSQAFPSLSKEFRLGA